jgi:hypothetical protein
VHHWHGSKNVRVFIDQFIVNELLNQVIGQDFREGVYLTSSLRRRAPETVLKFETEQAVTVVRVVFGEAVGRVQWDDPNTAFIRNACSVDERLLIGDFDKAVPGDRSQLAHLPQHVVAVIVHFPHTVEKVGDDGAVLLRASELDALSKTKVRNVIRHGADVVHVELGLAHFTTV